MSLPAHRSIEFVIGLATAVVPVILAVANVAEASAAAVLIAGALGIALITMGIASTREGTNVAPQAHATLDRVLIAALAVAGIALIVAGDTAVGTVLVAAALLELAITLVTTYATSAPDPSAGTTTATTS